MAFHWEKNCLHYQWRILKTSWQQCRQTGCSYQRTIESNLNVMQSNGPYQRSCIKRGGDAVLRCWIIVDWTVCSQVLPRMMRAAFKYDCTPKLKIWWVDKTIWYILNKSMKLYSILEYYVKYHMHSTLVFYDILFKIRISCLPSYMSPCGVTIDLFNKSWLTDCIFQSLKGSEEARLADFVLHRDARIKYPGACSLEFQSVMQILQNVCLSGILKDKNLKKKEYWEQYWLLQVQMQNKAVKYYINIGKYGWKRSTRW